MRAWRRETDGSSSVTSQSLRRPSRVVVPRRWRPPPLPGTTTTPWAVVVQGNAGGRHRLGTTTLLGRLSDCDVTLDDPSVSRRHARIRREGEDYVIEDLRSTNGVRVNGAERDYARLSDGDELELGSVRLSFSLER